MASTTITIICPECEKPLKAPSEVVGKKIRCKGCGHTFAVKAPQGKATKAAKPAGKDEDVEDDGAYGVTSEYLGARCPECANAMEDGDVICLHCGYNTITRQRARIRKVRDITGMDVFLHLLPGIICALALIGLVTADLLYIFLVHAEDFGEVWYDFIGGKAIKIWASIIVIGIGYLLGKYAVRRLIINYWPPEIEEKMTK
jgi:hypothetical protein